MFWRALLALLILQYAYATPTPHRVLSRRDNAVFTLKEAKAFVARRDLNISDSVFLLKEVAALAKSTSALLKGSVDSPTGDTAPLSFVDHKLGYGIDVGLSSQSFTLLFDTGSSDTWIAQTGFECVMPRGSTAVQVPQSQCHFGPLFSGQFQGGQIPDQHFIVSYGDNEQVAGVLGYEDVTVAGVTVNHQEIASVQLAYWLGDGILSGVLGFAYSTLTSAYKGSDISAQNPGTLVGYTNFIGNAISQGLIDPSFSIVLERPGGQSQVALGGLPSTSYEADFTTVPLQIVEFSSRLPIGATKYTYYTVDLDGFVLNGDDVGTKLPIIIDSGTSLAYLPPALARTINEAFDPPATYNTQFGYYETSCDATPIDFSIKIGGTEFHINAAELLLPDSVDSSRCATGISQSLEPPYILGGTFLKNVVAVFDIGAAEMQFAPHENY